eukprot:3221573-Rhodomonas_salina.1
MSARGNSSSHSGHLTACLGQVSLSWASMSARGNSCSHFWHLTGCFGQVSLANRLDSLGGELEREGARATLEEHGGLCSQAHSVLEQECDADKGGRD